MNTLFLKISSKNGNPIILPCQKIEVKEPIVIVKSVIQDHPKTFYLEIKHNHVNTLLDLTRVDLYELWYFDHKNEFTGKSFSLQKGDSPFFIQTQSPFIVLVPSNSKDVNQIIVNASTTYDEFTLSETL